MKKLIALGISTTLLLTFLIVLNVSAFAPQDKRWLVGTWYCQDANVNANFEVTSYTDNSFEAAIRIYNGANMTGVKGTAKFSQDNYAAIISHYSSHTEAYSFEIIDEAILVKYHPRILESYHVGIFKKEKPPEKNYDNIFTEYKILTVAQEQELKRITGEQYKFFATSLHRYSELKDLDGFNSKVIAPFVAGLYSHMASIIMVRNSDNAIWAATINVEDNVIYYFTNTNTKYIPKTIITWAQENPTKARYLIIWEW